MKTTSSAFILALILLCSHTFFAQTTFQRSIGGSYLDVGYSVIQASNGDYIVGGATVSYSESYAACYLIRLTPEGDTVWTKVFESQTESSADFLFTLIETSDGALVHGGNGFDIFGEGTYGTYLSKVDGNGDLLWLSEMDHPGHRRLNAVLETPDKGFIVAGYTDTTEFNTEIKIWLSKTNDMGINEWSYWYGGDGEDEGEARGLVVLDDGSFVAGGFTNAFGAGNSDMFLMKVDNLGVLKWSKTYGSEYYETARSLTRTNDGGFALAGRFRTDLIQNYDMCLIKTDNNGDTLWSKNYGGPGDDVANCVKLTSDGGFILVGSTLDTNLGTKDFYVVKTDGNGTLLWSRAFGGEEDDEAYSVEQSTDGDYIIAGVTNSYGAGDSDIYVVKIDANGDGICNLIEMETIETRIFPIVSKPTFLAHSHPLDHIATSVSVTFGGEMGIPCLLDEINEPVASKNTHIYPNPLIANATIVLDEVLEGASFELFDIMGKKVKHLSLNQSRTALTKDNLKSGVYIYQIRNRNSVIGRGILYIK